MPIEVFELSQSRGRHTYGLVSGFRRLAAVRALTGDRSTPTVAAFVRTPKSYASALKAMVKESAIRAELSPWEQALVAVTARDDEVFDTIEAAVDTLYASLNRDRRRRLRLVAHLIDEMQDVVVSPETLSQARLLRISAAAGRGFGPVIRHAMEESRMQDAATQWRLLQPILAESENPEIPAPSRAPDGRTRPRRTYVAPRHALRIRREQTRDGWCLHFTGRDASGEFMDTVFDYIEDMFTPT